MLKPLFNTVLLLSLLLPGLLQAEEPEQRWYQVEVIILAQKSADYKESELWPLDNTLPVIEGSRELLPYDATTPLPQPFSLLPAESLQLEKTARRIDAAGDMELMLHLGWVQPGLAEEQAVAIHVYEGMLEQPAEKPLPSSEGEANAELQTPAVEEEPLPRLDGTLRLILSRYLHMESNLLWREPLPPGMPSYFDTMLGTPETVASEGELGGQNEGNLIAAAEGEQPVVDAETTLANEGYQLFRLQQSRRMRSGEIHYIDHPLFGIIVVANRYELPVSEEAAPEQAQ